MGRSKVIKRRPAGSASFRTHDGAWYSSVTGRYLPLRDGAGNKIKGRENEPLAMIAVANLRMAVQAGSVSVQDEPPLTPVPTKKACTVRQVADVYLDYLKRECADNEFCKGRGVLNSFAKIVGDDKPINDLETGDLLKWLKANSNRWSSGTIHTYITIVLAAINHCIIHYGKSMGLTINPLRGFRKPPQAVRVTKFSPEQEQWVYDACDATLRPRLKQFIRFLIQTGARPNEAARITANHLKETATGLCVVFPGVATRDGGHKSGKKTGKERTIYLSPWAASLLRSLAEKNPNGPLFRRKLKNDGWTMKTLQQQWSHAKKWIEQRHGKFVDLTTGEPIVPYSCRHTFASRCYEAQKDIKLVARLLGNTVEVCIKHYVHDDEETAANYVQSIPTIVGDVLGLKVVGGVA